MVVLFEREESHSWTSCSGIFWSNLTESFFFPEYKYRGNSQHPMHPLNRYAVLPSFINVIYCKCAENKENEEGNEHVIYCSDVVHLKQLTVNTVQIKLISILKHQILKTLLQSSSEDAWSMFQKYLNSNHETLLMSISILIKKWIIITYSQSISKEMLITYSKCTFNF